MAYQIQILGLILMTLFMIFYALKKDKVPSQDKNYQYLLLLAYFLTLIDTIIAIALLINQPAVILKKLYAILTLSSYLGITFYMINTYLKEKYCSRSSILQKKVSLFKKCYIGLVIFHTIILLLIPAKMPSLNQFTLFFLIIYFVLTFVLLLKVMQSAKKKNFYHFWIVFTIGILSTLAQYYFNTLDFLTIGNIIIIFYLYLTIENMGIAELESLRLENAYNREQNIDKVAFLKNISHEIRTPINTIDGFSQIIMDTEDIKEIKKDVADMRIASRDLIDVINGLIDLSIIESGELAIIPENYNVYDMFDSIIEIAQTKLRDKSIDFQIEIEKNIPEVLWGDSERISQIILNLLKNAIKYTEKGTITLKVSRIKSETLCRLKIEVSDTGRGFKEEEIAKIYNPIETTEQSNLNLSVTNYLIEKMGGTLEVSSTFGKGACFMVTLDQKIISEKQEKSMKRQKEFKPFKATGKRILIVDDNKLNLKVAARLLAPYSVEVTESGSGQECLDILDQDCNFDLILMDDLMPGLSGTETMKLIKKIGRVDGYYIPIVALTANATSGQKEKYLESGFDDYLSKPIDRYELDHILKKYLKGNLSK